MNRNNIGDLMLSAISKYLSEKIPLYREVDPKPLVIEALMNNGLFTNENGVLGLSKLSEGYWEVLFFAADDREARKNLIQMAAKALGDISITFNRPKNNDTEKTFGPAFWRRLA
jgi:hypothetical protein